jgi:Arc/MetJ-type ribon-helix-helix transcriptional regulator
MKVSVSLPEEDVEFLDAYAREQGYPTRSAALHAAVGTLRSDRLADAYAEAWDSWTASAEAAAWDAVSGDALEAWVG